MKKIINFFKKNKLLSFLIFTGFILHLLISFPSGSNYCFEKDCGLYFWGAHEHDAIWHLAIIENAFKSFPPQHPIFAGEKLTGYNYFYDFIIFLLSKTGISSIIWYFKIIPVIWFVLYTFLSLKLAHKINPSYWFKIFFLFFNYFGASFGVFFALFHKKTIWGSSSSLAMQPLLSLVNPQFAFSLLFILLILINYFEKNFSKKIFLYFIYLFINFGLKFYAGVVSLFLISAFLIIEKKAFKKKLFSFFVFGLSTILSVVIFYQPFSASKTGSPLFFSPFSMVHHIIEERDLFYLPKLVNARYYLYQFGWGTRLLLIELLSVFLFIFFNFGVRFFGLLYLTFHFLKKKINFYYLAILLTILFSISFTAFFVQKGIWWNTIQFTYYGLFLGNIFAALFLFFLIKKRQLFYYLLITFLLLINVPENLDILKSFIPFKKSNFIPREEFFALNFLKNRNKKVVFSTTINKEFITNNNLHSAYISAFSGKQSYFANELQLIVTGVDYKKRWEKIKGGDCSIFQDIDYIYKKNNEKLDSFNKCGLKLKTIFKNNLVEIFEVNH